MGYQEQGLRRTNKKETKFNFNVERILPCVTPSGMIPLTIFTNNGGKDFRIFGDGEYDPKPLYMGIRQDVLGLKDQQFVFEGVFHNSYKEGEDSQRQYLFQQTLGNCGAVVGFAGNYHYSERFYNVVRELSEDQFTDHTPI